MPVLAIRGIFTDGEQPTACLRGGENWKGEAMASSSQGLFLSIPDFLRSILRLESQLF
jgi:hypothetical protein